MRVLVVALLVAAAVAAPLSRLPAVEDDKTLPARVNRALGQLNFQTSSGQESSTPPPGSAPGLPEELKDEEPAQHVRAKSADGREDMNPATGLPFDEDCDSPQIGESEAWHAEGVEVNMNQRPTNAASEQMAEPEDADQEILGDADDLAKSAEDSPAAFTGSPNSHPSEFLEPTEGDAERVKVLPRPIGKEAEKSKCSRSLNGLDTPKSMREMEDDCGSPGPEIPCETPGNSTRCEQQLQIKVPPVPHAELMPPIPPPDVPIAYEKPRVDIAVEFVDFGITKLVNNVPTRDTVGSVIEQAGSELQVQSWAVQLVRSAGKDVQPQVAIRSLPDPQQLVVYLTCTNRRFRPRLLMPIMACEDFVVHNFTARVEVPAYHAVYEVHVMSTETVGSVVSQAPIDLSKVDQVTYNGNNVSMDALLETVEFSDGSAFIVYPSEPCPTHTATPSTSPTPLPSVSPTPTLVYPTLSPSPLPGKVQPRAVDTYKRCRNSRGERITPPQGAPDLDPLGKGVHPDFECEESGPEGDASVDSAVHEEPGLGEEEEEEETRLPMTSSAKIIVEFEGRHIPVLVRPAAKGQDIFDAVEKATKQVHTHLLGEFLSRPIDLSTPLKPFGLRDGDKVLVRDLAHASSTPATR